MTTIRELVSEAFRESNLIQVGDVPEGSEYVEAEKKLLSFITSIIGTELGETLRNVTPSTSSQYVQINSRVVVPDDGAVTIQLPDHPKDGQRFGVIDPKGALSVSNSVTIVAGKGTIESASQVVLTTPNTESEWFYRADKGNWYPVTNLTSNDESPFPPKYDDLLTTWLAIRLSPRYGEQTKVETAQALARMLRMFKAQYRQEDPQASEDGLLRVGTNCYDFSLEWNRN